MGLDWVDPPSTLPNTEIGWLEENLLNNQKNKEACTIMLLVDVGSTFTKLAAIDIKNEVLLAKSSSPTTIFTDVSIGFRKALHKLREQLHGEEICLKERYASSSAAGGLKLIAIGLVIWLVSKIFIS